MQKEGFAEFKSHVLRREEKGLFGIPFKRLLFSALAGGAVTTVTKIPLPDLSVLLGIASVFVFLFLSAPRGGIPRWKLILFGIRWQLMMAAVLAPTSLAGSIGQALGFPREGLDIDGDVVFKPDGESAPRTALTDWISFSRYDSSDTSEGLVFSPIPGLDLAAE